MKNSVRMLSVSILCAAAIFAQNPSSAVWPLTANQAPVITGDIQALDQQLNGMQVTYSSSVQRSSPLPTAGTWAAESSENSGRFLQFSVRPTGISILSVSSVTMNLYVNSGSGMRANIYYSKDSTFSEKTAIGTTMTLSTTVPGVPNVNGVPNIDVNIGETFYVRVYPWNIGATTGKYVITNNVKITGSTRSSIAVLPSAAALNQFLQSAVAPSPVFYYTVSGTGLTNNVSVSAPAGFEITADSGTTWNTSAVPVVLTVAAGTVIGQPVPIGVRLNTASAGTVSGIITHTSTGAPTAEVSVTGVRLAEEPTLPSAIAITQVTGRSMKLNFSGGNGSGRVAVLRADSAVNWVPVDGMPVPGADSNALAATDLGNGNKAVYNGSGNTVGLSGLSSNVKYFLSVFEYNHASGNSYNYLPAAGTASATTIAVSTLSVTPSSLSYGMVQVNSVSAVQSYILSGAFLVPDTGFIAVSAPSGYSVSLMPASGFASALQLQYAGGSIDSSTIYVRLAPASVGTFNGSITHSGGTAPDVAVSVTGSGASASVFANTPIGYAALNGGTTGGAGGPVTTVTTLAELVAFAKTCENNTNPKVVMISGKISSPSTMTVSIKHGANVSILGAGEFGELENVGLNIWDYKNVIVRNMKIHEVFYPNDAVSIDECENVWIDHNELYSKIGPGIGVDTYDGLLDIKGGSKYVTVSWNHLHHHMKCSLIGHTDNTGQQAMDSQFRITYHHNWFSNTDGRNPSIRFGAIHMFNNYFEDVSDYGIAARNGAHAKIENSHYHNVLLPMSTDKFPVDGLPNGYIWETGNLFTGTSGSNIISQTGADFWNSTSLPYSYTLDSVGTVAGTVTMLAGTGITLTAEEEAPSPRHYGLRQNFPNPFNPSTTIQFSVQQDQPVTLAVYNTIGQRVETLYSGFAEVGRLYSVRLDGRSLSSGMYFTVLESGAQRQVKKILLMK
jgi:pectate lyase